MKHPTTPNYYRTALLIIILTTMLSACQSLPDLLRSSTSPENAAINEVMTQEREGFHIEPKTFRTFITQEVGDWVLVGVRMNVQTQNNVGDPVQRVGCIAVEKATRKSIGWEASDAGGLCTALNPLGKEPLTISSGWARGDNFQQEPEYNLVFGFLDPEMPQDITINVTWEDGQSISLKPDQAAFMVVHPGPGHAEYTKVEFIDANGEIVYDYQRSQ